MRAALVMTLSVLAFVVGCSQKPANVPKDPRVEQRVLLWNTRAERCEKDAALLREQAQALLVKAKEKELQAKRLRKNARDAAEGKMVLDPDDSTR